VNPRAEGGIGKRRSEMSTPETSAQQGCEPRARGWYIYGIVPGDVEMNDDAQGVGDPPGKVDVVRHGDIAALVSEVDTSKPLGRPEDLMAHEQLLDSASTEAPILPLRFGAVVANREAVIEELLAPNHDQFAKALGELEGSTEYVVHGRYVEEKILREVLSESAEATRLRDEIRAVGNEDATRDEQIRLGELISNAINVKREADTRALSDAVAPYCIATNVRQPAHELDAMNVAMLIKTAGQADLEKAVEKLARGWTDRVNVRLLGPMAPYDFVTTSQPEG
jgi:hypothetical protein